MEEADRKEEKEEEGVSLSGEEEGKRWKGARDAFEYDKSQTLADEEDSCIKYSAETNQPNLLLKFGSIFKFKFLSF